MKNKTCGDCRYLDKNRYCNFLDFEPNPQMKGCANFEPKPTNGDRIRQMRNEKLGEFLRKSACDKCIHDCDNCNYKCADGVLAWLNAPDTIGMKESEGEDE